MPAAIDVHLVLAHHGDRSGVRRGGGTMTVHEKPCAGVCEECDCVHSGRWCRALHCIQSELTSNYALDALGGRPFLPPPNSQGDTEHFFAGFHI